MSDDVMKPTIIAGSTSTEVAWQSMALPKHAESKIKKAATVDRVPVKINRNLMNFPLARDTRTDAKWFAGNKTGRWMADLPGEGRKSHRIRLILPANAAPQERR